MHMWNKNKIRLNVLQGVCIISSHLLYECSIGSNSCVNRNNDVWIILKLQQQKIDLLYVCGLPIDRTGSQSGVSLSAWDRTLGSCYPCCNASTHTFICMNCSVTKKLTKLTLFHSSNHKALCITQFNFYCFRVFTRPGGSHISTHFNHTNNPTLYKAKS
jgi:hypothetical protein